MNNLEMARAYMRQAEERLHHAEEALSRENYCGETVPGGC